MSKIGALRDLRSVAGVLRAAWPRAAGNENGSNVSSVMAGVGLEKIE
jgi:hypothetical protein